jgi:PAS domain S-box-containing protein
MKAKNAIRMFRPVLAQLPPIAALILQWTFWPVFRPFIWFLFYPAVFCSSWIGGLSGGLAATAVSVALVFFFFVQPQLSFAVEDPKIFFSVGVFTVMGAAFSFTHSRLRKTHQQLTEALAAADSAKQLVETQVHERTVELTQANKLMRNSEERLRLLISGVKDYAIFMLDPEGRVVDWNPGAQRIKGWHAEEIIGQHFSRFYLPQEVADKKPQRELEIAKSEGRFEEEGWRLRKDGSRFWANVLITPLHDDQGRFAGFAKVTRDLNERHRIEQTIKEEEARLAAVIGSAMDAVVTVDANQRITLFNPAAERMFACSAADAMGRSLDRFIPERFRSQHASHIHNFGQTNITRRSMGEMGAIYGLRSNGEEFPIEASISQVQIGEQRMFSVILRDITERKRAEEELRQQASLLDLANALVRDMESRIVFWSSGSEKIYGYTKAEALGRSCHELLQTGFPIPLAQIEQIFEKEGNWEGELLHRTRDGSQVVVASQWVTYRDSQGKPIRVLEVNRDITSSKRAEALQLRSQKLESLGTLAGGIAHDFNNILLAITGNTKLAMADLPPEHPVQESLAEIGKAGTRATDLVRRILAFSRPQELERKVLHLQPIVEEALKLLRATLPSTVEFRSEFAKDLAPVVADASQVHQIIVNLGTNAAHAIGTRSGLIEFRLDVADLRGDHAEPPAGIPKGAYICLTVADNGCGMDRAVLDRIFDPFFTTKAPGEGTGLGLSVVHGIIQNHGGAIRVYSDLGRGTAFYLYFPAAASAVERSPEPPRPVQRGRSERVLYVDDEEPLVFLVKRMLERLGYRVSGFTDATRALEEFRSRPRDFDVVVTDLSMPRMSGFELAHEILAARPDVPIVMTSGYVRPEDQQKALEMGLRDLIPKPHTIEQLGRTLDALFHHDTKLTKVDSE